MLDAFSSQPVESFPGHTAAVAQARALEKHDCRFILAVRQDLPQGKNNRVLAATWEGRPAVFKYFDDAIHSPGAALRRQTEAFALQHYAGLDAVPRLFAQYGQALVIERLSSTTLASEVRCRQDGADLRPFLETIGGDLGVSFARMAGRGLTVDTAQGCATAFHQGMTLAERLERLAAAGEAIADLHPLLRPHRDTLALIRAAIPAVAAEPPLLYRYDNNFDNLLIREGRLCGLIDYEMCYLGTESMLLGALLDTVPEIYPLFPNRPSWSAIAAAYGRERDRPIAADELPRIAIMAMANHWLRIAGTHGRIPDLGRYAERFAGRFPVLKRLYGEGHGQSVPTLVPP